MITTLEELTNLRVLNESAYECTRQSRWKESTQRYLANMLANNVKLCDDVMNHRYAVSPTIDFTINERGHTRKIEAPVVRDRVVQKPLSKYVLIPAIRPLLIYDNYASLEKRGTSFARKRIDIMLRRYYKKHGIDGYVLLIDVRKYFESVDHEILKRIIDEKLPQVSDGIRSMVHYAIDTSSHGDKGLNLGGEAPQIMAVYYLNRIDQYVKVVKGVRYYGRYMDDIFIIGQTKEELRSLLSEIKEILTELKLSINEKKTHIVKISHGFTFLQVKYNMLPSGKILKRMTHGKIVRERRRLVAFRRMVDEGKMTEEEVWNCYQSWRGTVVKDHNACYRTVGEMDKLCIRLFPNHEKEVRKGRKELTGEIMTDAESQDLKFLFNN